ncbi:MAG TPA: DNA polymerase III subunit delta' [Hyphomicrobiaceae bacterium]|nr:DNA polymerase III subunit delta' [Hyphomicrobiaceae bacterium]
MARAPVVREIEAPPENDRLEDFPHPRETVALYGHDSAEQELAAALAGGRMHHAWLLSGPPGIGKATLAYRVAMAVLAGPDVRDAFGMSLAVDPQSVSARQVRAQSHPGLLVLRRQYNLKDKRFAQSISVDEVRRLRAFLGLRGGDDAWRVVIVDSANDLNVNAANALLKSLEEPPERTLFLLVTSEPGRLLATIRSRCRVLDLKRLAPEDLGRAAHQALAAVGRDMPGGEDAEVLLRLADGSVRRFLALEAGGGLALYKDIYALLSALPDVAWGKVHQLADTLSGHAAEVRFELFFELLLELLARIIRTAATGEGAAEDVRLAERMTGSERLATLAEVWETVAREKAETVALNLDRKTLILRTVSRLEATNR